MKTRKRMMTRRMMTKKRPKTSSKSLVTTAQLVSLGIFPFDHQDNRNSFEFLFDFCSFSHGGNLQFLPINL